MSAERKRLDLPSVIYGSFGLGTLQAALAGRWVLAAVSGAVAFAAGYGLLDAMFDRLRK
jgi:ABC-type phosphate transport system permease subunit